MSARKEEARTTADRVAKAFEAARRHKPAYQEIYPFLEPLLLAQIKEKSDLSVSPPALDEQTAREHLAQRLPLLKRWDFPVDIEASERLLQVAGAHVPEANLPLKGAHEALAAALAKQPEQKGEVWRSFLHHEWEPWEEWVRTEGVDLPSLLFLARSCLRPSVERTAEALAERFGPFGGWTEGHCPVCGSLPSLITFVDQGQRRGHCSWCGSTWGLNRMQCPFCDNRDHDSLGYLAIEQEPQYRVQYCRACRRYFKALDLREWSGPFVLALEEWVTLHLDILAQRSGFLAPPSPSPAVYSEASA